ncbi:asparaginase [Faecalicatena orotica]|uniref:asparaginase n=1 Tax=Faecalicatena orotica TaxID=1544 RepID=UPI003216B5B0
MKKILIINTGGTFSSVENGSGLAPGISGEQITDLLSPEPDMCRLKIEDYCSLDSANISPDDWRKISQRISRAAEACDGVVIIHGTDVMAYTASMLSFMLLHVPIPVILTGSQLPLFASMTDAVDNFQSAVQMALTGKKGVYVVFSRKIMLGCRTSKVRTVSFDAFESINYPQAGEFNAKGLQLNESVLPGQEGSFSLCPVYSDKIAVLKVFPGISPDIFSYLYDKGYEGVFIEGFGLGGVPFMKNNLLREIDRASAKGMPILVGSQCRYEGSDLSVYETGQRVKACGGIPVYDMTQEATVTKLMWCLGQTKDRGEIQRFFQTNFVNEVTLTCKNK